MPNDFALYQMPKGEFVVGSMTIVPSLDIVMNKEEQAKAKEAKGSPHFKKVQFF